MNTVTTSAEPQDRAATPTDLSWFQRLARSGHVPGDSVELKRQKSLLVVITLLKASICAGWYIPLALLGASYAAGAPFFYQLATVISVWLFARGKGWGSFRTRQMFLILLLPLGVHFGLGGFAPSGGVLIWSFLAPLISLLFETPKQSLRWFLAFVGAILIASVVEFLGVLPVHHLPWWMKLLFFAMNFICVSGITYAGIRYFSHLLENEKAVQVELNHQLKLANEHKSKFLAGMSHELRTPLNAIIGFTRIVKRRGKKTLPEKQVGNLDKVLVSAEHLLSLINDILDLAKIEAGHIEVENAAFSLPTLVKACVNTSETLVKEGVVLSADVPSDLPPVYADEGKVKQIVLNLISNAAKFTHEGEIKVQVQIHGDEMSVAVKDTGIGISEEAKERIFKEFQQADSSTTREYGGTGLGLSISSRLAQLMGGSLTVDSVEGEGSVFTLNLPLVKAEGAISRSPERVPARVSQPQSQGFAVEPTPVPAVREVLAIDDDPDVIYLLQENLQDAGYRVVGARSGTEGVQKASEIQPYAITLDIMMPQKDGWQTLHELKKNPQTKDIPVIMLSIIDNKQLGYQLGATDFLLKPLNAEAIKQALGRLAPADVPHKKVFVVDNTPEVGEQIKELLRDTVYDIAPFETPERALEMFEECQPDVIVVDLVKLEEGGMQWIERLRRHPEHRKIPMLVLTSPTLPEDHKEVLQQGWTRILEMHQMERETLIGELQSALQQFGA